MPEGLESEESDLTRQDFDEIRKEVLSPIKGDSSPGATQTPTKRKTDGDGLEEGRRRRDIVEDYVDLAEHAGIEIAERGA